MKKVFNSIILALLSAFVSCILQGNQRQRRTEHRPAAFGCFRNRRADGDPHRRTGNRSPDGRPKSETDPVTVEWLAAEMQCRYYVGCMNLELMDFSDIMDRNEDTDLFFWDNQLEIDLKKLGRGYNFVQCNH